MRLWARRSKVSNTGNGECFLCCPKCPDWLWGPHSLLVSMNWPSSLGIKRPGSQPNKSPPPSAKVMMLSTKFPSVLCFQLNEQKVKAVCVSGTDSTVESGLAAVQIGTVLLVKVSVWN